MLQQLHEFFITYQQPDTFYSHNMTLLQYMYTIYDTVLKQDPNWYYIFEHPSLLIRVSSNTVDKLNAYLIQYNVNYQERPYKEEWNKLFKKYNHYFTAINHATSQLMMNIKISDCKGYPDLVNMLDRVYHLTGNQSKYLLYNQKQIKYTRTDYNKLEQYEYKSSSDITIDRTAYNCRYCNGISYWTGILLQSNKVLNDDDFKQIRSNINKGVKKIL